jgi:hypothetical protein
MAEWEKRDGGGITRVEDGLGRIDVYEDRNGCAIDINGQRAWSAFKGTERRASLWVDGDVRMWKYIQGFIANKV